MTLDPDAPATKEDIRLLMGEIGRLYAANERWKDELKGHFDVVAEDIRHDFRGGFADTVDQHEDRIARLERQLGFVR